MRRPRDSCHVYGFERPSRAAECFASQSSTHWRMRCCLFALLAVRCRWAVPPSIVVVFLGLPCFACLLCLFLSFFLYCFVRFFLFSSLSAPHDNYLGSIFALLVGSFGFLCLRAALGDAERRGLLSANRRHCAKSLRSVMFAEKAAV